MYKLLKISTQWNSLEAVIRISDGACIPFDPDNTDYQEYLKWCEAGGVALPADEPASQPADEV
jgi:hypothetical protein